MASRPAAEILAELEPLGVRLGLDPFRRLLAVLGSPELASAAVLVAGTNGKGSVAAMLDSIGRAAGLRTGLYTSPHLASYGERIRTRGEPIDDETLAERLTRVLGAAGVAGLPPPTVFEALTAVAFLHFAALGVELAVLEVGLGGRLDATNAAEPLLSIVTPLGLDHRAELGSTLAAIAREKAGVLRKRIAAVVAAQPAVAAAALAAETRRIGALVRHVGVEVTVEAAEWRGLDGHRLRLRTPRALYELDLALAGEHQVDNAAAAVCAAELLAERWPSIDTAAIGRGIAGARWPGRLEAFVLPGSGTTLLLDAAHNPAGCAALAKFLARLAAPYHLLFGCLADKDAAGMLPALATPAERVVLTRPRSARAQDPGALARHLPQPASALVVAAPEAALDEALSRRPALLVVAGSIYLVGELRAAALARGARARCA